MKKLKVANFKYMLAAVLMAALISGSSVSAEGVVGMSCPDSVQRGYSFKVQITASNAVSGVLGVQLHLQYPVSQFTFVKANSIFLGTAGGQISSSGASVFELQDTSEGIINLLYVSDIYYPPDTVIAELEFTPKTDALIGPSSFRFVDDSFVLLNGEVKIPATTDTLNFEVMDYVSEPVSNEPLPPAENPSNPPAPSLEEPYNPQNQVEPAEGLEGKNADNYAIGKINEESEPAPTAETTTLPSQTEPRSSRSEAPSITQPDSEDTPLRSVTGVKLYLPEGGLPLDKIPQGFKGDTAQVMGLNIPIAKSESDDLVLYYLASDQKPAFYTYEESTERFKLFDMAKVKMENPTTKAKSRFTAGGEQGNTWKILLVSLLTLTSLSVFIYSLRRNLKML